MFIFVQFWTISIHDGVDIWPGPNVLNGSAHHTIHHAKFLFNYGAACDPASEAREPNACLFSAGQYFTFWDKWNSTYMDPQPDEEAKLKIAKDLKQQKPPG